MQIASNVNITSNERSEKLRQLLQMNGVHIPINTCDALDFSFNEEPFSKSLISNANVTADITENEWSFKLSAFGNSCLVKLMFCDHISGELDVNKSVTNTSLIRIPSEICWIMLSDSNSFCFFAAAIMKYNKIKHGMHEKEDTEFRLWVRFGDIEYIYPIDKPNAKVTREELEKENKDRWIEIPNDCLKIKLNGDHNLTLIEKQQDDGAWPRAKGDDWRKTLQTGDIIGAMDDEGKWYESLVRYVYAGDHATMSDKCVIHYIGWNKKWDEIVNVEDDRLQKRNSMTKGLHIHSWIQQT